ncbi:HNH endonuclease signature motif containing protein [Plantibacter sp. LMC-P-059a]|uniref:HNH endonuclease signature motif containing protein n=1 Tax=Plantibacter sp. LMC-P-059a TaxID=3040297 RepID=UPI00254B0652|nr:HNH endonuclease signature motif containing protein [Plantibacter sp. LMC-P-059a]
MTENDAIQGPEAPGAQGVPAQQAHPSDVFADRIASFTDRFVGLARRRAALDAEEARLLAEAFSYADATASALVSSGTTSTDARDLARRSMCASLAIATRMSEPTLQARVGDAEALVHDAPTVLEALAQGTISGGHARAITDQLRDVPAEGRSVFLEQVLPVATRSTAARLRQRARVVRERLHPESFTARRARSITDRRVELEAAADGMAWVHLFTTAPLAHAIRNRLDAVAVPARVAGDTRALAQLRADAFASLAVAGTVQDDAGPIPVDPETTGTFTWLPGSAPLDDAARIAEEAAAAGADPLLAEPVGIEARIRATVQMTVPALSALGVTDEPGELDGYGPIDPDTAARLAVTAPSMTRILTQPETGAVLSVGRGQYRVPADFARAVRLRDTTCRAPGCGRAARSCDLDHSVAWQDGGSTAIDNLACLCRHHHWLKHLPGWNLEHHPGGVLTWTTPDGRRHETRPELAETG